jgi:hypothetical protein
LNFLGGWFGKNWKKLPDFLCGFCSRFFFLFWCWWSYLKADKNWLPNGGVLLSGFFFFGNLLVFGSDFLGLFGTLET